MPAPLHKVEEERCHSLNGIYGLSLRRKLDSKYITVEVASPTATCLHCRCAKTHTAGLLREAARLPAERTRSHRITSASLSRQTSAVTGRRLDILGVRCKLVIQFIKCHPQSQYTVFWFISFYCKLPSP